MSMVGITFCRCFITPSNNLQHFLAVSMHNNLWRLRVIHRIDAFLFKRQFNSIILFQNWIESKSNKIIAMSIYFDNFTIISCFHTNSTSKTIIYCFKSDQSWEFIDQSQEFMDQSCEFIDQSWEFIDQIREFINSMQNKLILWSIRWYLHYWIIPGQ